MIRRALALSPQMMAAKTFLSITTRYAAKDFAHCPKKTGWHLKPNTLRKGHRRSMFRPSAQETTQTGIFVLHGAEDRPDVPRS